MQEECACEKSRERRRRRGRRRRRRGVVVEDEKNGVGRRKGEDEEDGVGQEEGGGRGREGEVVNALEDARKLEVSLSYLLEAYTDKFEAFKRLEENDGTRIDQSLLSAEEKEEVDEVEKKVEKGEEEKEEGQVSGMGEKDRQKWRKMNELESSLNNLEKMLESSLMENKLYKRMIDREREDKRTMMRRLEGYEELLASSSLSSSSFSSSLLESRWGWMETFSPLLKHVSLHVKIRLKSNLTSREAKELLEELYIMLGAETGRLSWQGGGGGGGERGGGERGGGDALRLVVFARPSSCRSSFALVVDLFKFCDLGNFLTNQRHARKIIKAEVVDVVLDHEEEEEEEERKRRSEETTPAAGAMAAMQADAIKVRHARLRGRILVEEIRSVKTFVVELQQAMSRQGKRTRDAETQWVEGQVEAEKLPGQLEEVKTVEEAMGKRQEGIAREGQNQKKREDEKKMVEVARERDEMKDQVDVMNVTMKKKLEMLKVDLRKLTADKHQLEEELGEMKARVRIQSEQITVLQRKLTSERREATGDWGRELEKAS
ncbi:hypothetical protein GUITHDRAFT_135877 [Guillardia theta CCMP2712]|uniref:Uncharacterized protein n=1 Tax=Guillardia theta (strain CCMP2712) TaxID=905079 RepID=L1JM83_GUITC|nr:hypothetical protein GUITHDRAFT_135877 [Guillardia theta CCMP2712]EKX49711.1 hypothetical protein GUITHDRAFT_135877 [Guillardia theta CCMP2712]|eukprot:XP_005836691.1 hypothetical protein GUITHDRAFT_135877 [Guillardia theta CCMP2712]